MKYSSWLPDGYIAGFLDRMCLALRASGLWLRYAALLNLILSFPWIAPPTPSTLAQSKERKGSNFAIWQPWYQVVIDPELRSSLESYWDLYLLTVLMGLLILLMLARRPRLGLARQQQPQQQQRPQQQQQAA